MWESFKSDARQVLGDLRIAVNPKLDQEHQSRCWGTFATIVKAQLELERIITNSGKETGWTQNPIPSLERLIKATAEIDELEFESMSEELENLKRKAEDILVVSSMSSWEKVLKAQQQEETFMKRCCRRLQKWKEEKKKDRETEKRLREMLSTIQMPPNSGFRE
jgi:hypothetical protein